MLICKNMPAAGFFRSRPSMLLRHAPRGIKGYRGL